jgi:hypothetical protein
MNIKWFLINKIAFLFKGKTCEKETSDSITGKTLKSFVNFNVIKSNLKEEIKL